MTTPEPPLSAPSASSQALPADQAHPAVRAGQDAYMELLRTGDGCPGSHDVAAAVAPAVLRWVMDRLRQEARIADDPTWNSILGAVDALKDELTEITRSTR